MVQLRTGQNLKTRAKRAALRVIRSINQSRNARLNDSSRAHRAGLQRHIKSRIGQSVIPKRAGGFTQYDHFSVSGWIAIPNRAVARFRDHCSTHTSTAPMGTSPASAEARASSIASCMYSRSVAIDVENTTLKEGYFKAIASISPVARILDNRTSGKETESMKELLGRLFQLDFIKGMGVTFRTQNPKNIYTEQYPLERPLVAERYRGAPRLNDNPETGETCASPAISARSPALKI